MKIVTILLIAAGGTTGQCNPNHPTPDAGDAGTGGLTATGGALATGGNSAITGGSIATGGTTGCGAIEALVPGPITRELAKRVHTVGKRHHRKKGRAVKTEELSLICPVLHDSNNATPLDQDLPKATGSCTGNASVGAISTQSFQGTTHYNQSDARLAYQGGTCEDNDCTVPCTCKSCPAAFCPDTNVNDTGSTGSSVMKWMTSVGWIKGFTTADTISDLQACLAKGSNPVIGIDWWSGMDNPGKDAEIFATGYIRGGHELRLVGWNGTKFIGINSWGRWGYCRQSQINSNTSIDGTGCGYFTVGPTTLVKANFDGDCPNG